MITNIKVTIKVKGKWKGTMIK
ncbi:hypothetical protein PFDG_04552 [Plasmodium falciparum Dd2]|uniref:Uncharacterized protein n=1 Tax=Plasmodium falciparum (isolate Dd2) TaxID=57267 RepID=A0A0L7M6E7_PLAF4|nr:hypothetical protein PFDG_04552 [Plasmodium falciparum Dd2]